LKLETGIDDKNIPTFVFNFIVSFLAEQGLKKNEILFNVGIKAQDLECEETRISYRQGLKLIDNALRLSAEPTLGLMIGKKQRLSDWGLLGYVLSSCQSGLDALRLSARYYQLSRSLSNFSYSVEHDEIIVQLNTPFPAGDLLPYIVEESFASQVSVGRALQATLSSPKRIRVSYCAPSYSEAYHGFFRCPIQFEQPVNQIVWDRETLEAPFPSHNLVTEKLAIKLCEEMLSKEQSDTVYQTRQILLQSPGNFPSMAEVAREMMISERTLRRQLKQQGVSFQSIFDSVRAKIAIEYLGLTRLPLEDIAYLVGFSETGSFHRAFKKWTGKTPLEYRE